MQGIVFNPHYLMYFDVAFTEYMRAIGLPYPNAFAADDTDTFMVSIQADFRASARYDQEIAIFVRTAYFGTTSFRMAFSIRHDDEILVEGTATYVNGDRQTHAPRPIPTRLVDTVTHFETLRQGGDRRSIGRAKDVRARARGLRKVGGDVPSPPDPPS
jgi:acyl-CoA thioester hydrolase